MAKFSTFFFILVLAFGLSEVRAQDTCITISGGVTLTSQAQLDAYWQQNPGLCIDSILGDLILAGDVEDLSGFMGLRYIGGGIFAPGSLQRSPSLRGLDSLTEIDDFLTLNTQVYDLDALSNLRAIGRDIDNNLSGGYSKRIMFGAGSYDNLDALSNLQSGHECHLSISNCDVRDATGLRNIRGLYTVSLYQSEIEIFPDIPSIDSLHRLDVYRVNGLKELHFSGLEYLNELEIDDNPDLKSLTFDTPIYMGKRKRSPDYQYFDNDAEISISGEIECLTAEFRRADSLEFLEVRISSRSPFTPSCPLIDFSRLPMDRVTLSRFYTGDTLILPFTPPSGQFTWGDPNLSTSNNRYGVEYQLIGLEDVRYLIVPDTGIIKIHDLYNLQDIEIDVLPGRGQIQGLVIDNCESLVEVQALKQLHGSVMNYLRPANGSNAAIRISDCMNLELDQDDFYLVDSAISILLSDLPSITAVPMFSELEYVEDFSLENVPIHNDTLFSDKISVEHSLSFDFRVDNVLPAYLHINYDSNKDTLTKVSPDGFSGIQLGYWGKDISVTGMNNVSTVAGLAISGVHGFKLDGSNLLRNVSKANSYLLGRPSFVEGRNKGELPKIGKIDQLFQYAFQRDDGTWFTRYNNEELAIVTATEITDATAVCPLINSGNYQSLYLDPSNSYPLYDAATLVSYCDSNRISSTSNLGQWKAFTVYPTVNTSGGTVNFKGLENYSGTLRYRILDLAGREQGRGRLVNGSYGRVDAIALPHNLLEGQYFLDVLDDEGRRGTSVIQIVMRP